MRAKQKVEEAHDKGEYLSSPSGVPLDHVLFE
jgi:hypothetical protein